MSAGPNDLTTLAAVQAYLPPDTPSGDTALLQTLITAASTLIQSYLGYNIAAQSFTDIRNGNGRDSLTMLNAPVTAVSSVVIDGTAISESTGWPVCGWTFDDTTLYLINSIFRRGRRNIIVSYTAGYAAVPNDLAQACTELVTFRYNSRNKAGSGLISESAMQQTTSYSQADMPNSVKAAIAPYRRVFAA